MVGITTPLLQGLGDLRQVVAQEVSLSRNIEVGPEEVVVTPGADLRLFYATSTELLGQGTEKIAETTKRLLQPTED